MTTSKRKHPSVRESGLYTVPTGIQVAPIQYVRLDHVDPMPDHLGKIMRCKNRGCSGTTRFYCAKCNVSLCLSDTKNCFKDFHTKY